MKTLVFALLVSCAPASAATPSPTPQVIYLPGPTQVIYVPGTPAPYPSPTARVFDSHSFTVALSIGEDVDAPTAQMLLDQLSPAWTRATSARSQLRLVSKAPDVYVHLGVEPPVALSPTTTQYAYFVMLSTLRFVYVHRGTPNPLLEVIHELGHTGGCCFGSGNNVDASGHWVDCPTPSVEIMCHFQGSATTFSERELQAMGLR